ncbi:MAG: hypothetical protein AB2L14_23880 [Candidatus Xenobiia bacterium LiM19]
MNTGKTAYMIFLLMIMILMLTQQGYCKTECPSPDTPIINIGQLTEEKLHEFQSICDRKGGEFIFYAPEGFEMAVKLKVEGSVVTMKEGGDTPITIKFQTPVYFYASSKKGSDPLFSLDGKRWCMATELFGGMISFGAGSEKKGEESMPVFNLTMKLDLKSKPAKQ